MSIYRAELVQRILVLLSNTTSIVWTEEHLLIALSEWLCFYLYNDLDEILNYFEQNNLLSWQVCSLYPTDGQQKTPDIIINIHQNVLPLELTEALIAVIIEIRTFTFRFNMQKKNLMWNYFIKGQLWDFEAVLYFCWLVEVSPSVKSDFTSAEGEHEWCGRELTVSNNEFINLLKLQFSFFKDWKITYMATNDMFQTEMTKTSLMRAAHLFLYLKS